jgi:8-oxo-dGTP pyrophosphatase MutT (NUDIX family)
MADTNPPIPAATVVVVRDGEHGLETLLIRRNAALTFAGGMWVFPGGRIDADDYPPDAPDDEVAGARRAAVREAAEEAGLVLDAAELVAFSHWTAPAISPKRFATWFFLAPCPAGAPVVTVDGGEIHAFAWMRPADALARRDAGEVDLAPPTCITLHRMAGWADVTAARLDAARDPERFETRFRSVDGGVVAMYAGDVAYDDGDIDAPGPRHRLWMLESGWRYERDSRER